MKYIVIVLLGLVSGIASAQVPEPSADPPADGTALIVAALNANGQKQVAATEKMQEAFIEALNGQTELIETQGDRLDSKLDKLLARNDQHDQDMAELKHLIASLALRPDDHDHGHEHEDEVATNTVPQPTPDPVPANPTVPIPADPCPPLSVVRHTGSEIVLFPGERLLSVNGVPVVQQHIVQQSVSYQRVQVQPSTARMTIPIPARHDRRPVTAKWQNYDGLSRKCHLRVAHKRDVTGLTCQQASDMADADHDRWRSGSHARATMRSSIPPPSGGGGSGGGGGCPGGVCPKGEAVWKFPILSRIRNR